MQKKLTGKLLGHFGVIKLAATVHNSYFIEEVVQLLNQICPGCLTLKQNGDTKVCNHQIDVFHPE
jgi:DNA-directed RNA polymerase beta' subunit